MNKRNILIILGSSIVVGGVGYFVYTKFRNKREIREIHAKLDGNEGSYGSIEDFQEVFNGSSYVQKMKNAHKNIIQLKPAYITKYRRELEDAIVGAGTDEVAIKDVFRKLKDRVQVAEVSDSYQRHNGENLLDALLDDMDADDKTMKELLEMMINKLAYRINK
jgi:hypothetical protein